MAQSLPARADDAPRIAVAAERRFHTALFTPDRRHLISTAEDNPYGVALWDVETGRALWTIGHGGYSFYGGAFSSDGQRILLRRAANFGRTVRFELLDARNGTVLSNFEGLSSRGARLSANGREIATGGRDGRLELWDGRTGLRLRTLSEEGVGVDAVAFSPDGGRVLCKRGDKIIEVWDAAGGLLNVHRSEKLITHAVFSPDGRRVAFRDWDGARSEHSVRLWDVESGAVSGKTQAELGIKGWHNADVAFSPDGRNLYYYSDNVLATWEFENGGRLTALEGKVQSSPVKEVPGGGLISIAGREGRSSVDVERRGLAEEEFGADSEHVYSPDGRRMLTGVLEADRTAIQYWDAKKGKLLPIEGGKAQSPHPLRISPDGKRLWASWECGPEHAAYGLWNLAARKFLRGECVDGWVTPLFLRDGRRALSAKDGRLVLIDVDSDKTIRAMEGTPEGGPYFKDVSGEDAFALALGFRKAAAGGRDGAVRLWDLKSGRRLKEMRGHAGEVLKVLFSPDGRRIASFGADRALKLWDAASGRLLAAREGIEQPVSAVGFSRDGRQVFVVDGNKAARLLDLRKKRTALAGRVGDSETAQTVTGGEVTTWLAEKDGEPGRFQMASSGAANGWRSPDGRRRASIDGDGALRITSELTGKLLATFVLGRKGEWLVVTPEGFFGGSAHGAELARITAGQQTLPLEPLRKWLYRPDLVQRILSNGRDRRYRAASRKHGLVRLAARQKAQQ